MPRHVLTGELVLNVKDFGAKGDGVTDDRPAILTAVTAATGGTLLFPPGVYVIGGAVGLASNSRYVGHGATLKKSGTGAAFAVAGVTGVTVEGFAFDGAGLASAVLTVENSTDVVVRDVTARGGADFGVYVFNSTRVLLDGVKATANGNAGTSDAGIYLNGYSVRAVNCVAYDNAGHGFRIHGNSTSQGNRVTLIGCVAHSNDMHGYLGGSSNGTHLAPLNVGLHDCHATDNGSGGIYSGFALHYLNRMTATGLTASGNVEHGIVLMDLEHATLSGFQSSFNAKAGLRLQSDFALAQNSRSGVRNSVISGGHLAGNWSANTSDSAAVGAVQIDGTRKTKITDLMITGTRGVAVRIDDPANYTDSSDLELGFTSYDNTLGNYGNAQPAGGIYGSYRVAGGGVTAIATDPVEVTATNGTRYRVTVETDGTLTTTAL